MTKLRIVFPSSQNIQLGRVFLWTVICMPRNTCLGILSSKYFSFLFCFSCVCAWVSVCERECVCVCMCVCECACLFVRAREGACVRLFAELCATQKIEAQSTFLADQLYFLILDKSSFNLFLYLFLSITFILRHKPAHSHAPTHTCTHLCTHLLLLSPSPAHSHAHALRTTLLFHPSINISLSLSRS